MQAAHGGDDVRRACGGALLHIGDAYHTAEHNEAFNEACAVLGSSPLMSKMTGAQLDSVLPYKAREACAPDVGTLRQRVAGLVQFSVDAAMTFVPEEVREQNMQPRRKKPHTVAQPASGAKEGRGEVDRDRESGDSFLSPRRSPRSPHAGSPASPVPSFDGSLFSRAPIALPASPAGKGSGKVTLLELKKTPLVPWGPPPPARGDPFPLTPIPTSARSHSGRREVVRTS